MFSLKYYIIFVVVIVATVLSLFICYMSRKKNTVKVFFVFSAILVTLFISKVIIDSFIAAQSGPTISLSYNTTVLDDVIYRSGFYNNLVPINITRIDQKHTYDNKDFYRVDYNKFDFIHYNDGTMSNDKTGLSGGEIYCNINQWEEAKSFYETPENFVIKYKIGPNNQTLKSGIIENFDFKIFEELFNFSQRDEFHPLKYNASNSVVIKYREDNFKSLFENELTIYKESVDELFKTRTDRRFQIIEDKLYILINYNFEEDDYVKVTCAEVPDEISQYVIKMISSF